MGSPERPNRYVLVPRDEAAQRSTDTSGVRRFQLARIAVSPRSALGVDRHERLERIAALRRDAQAD